MSNNASYIITTLSRSVNDFQLPLYHNSTASQAPFRIGPFAQQLRQRCIPYAPVDSGPPAASDCLDAYEPQDTPDGTIDGGGTPKLFALTANYPLSLPVTGADGTPNLPSIKWPIYT